MNFTYIIDKLQETFPNKSVSLTLHKRLDKKNTYIVTYGYENGETAICQYLEKEFIFYSDTKQNAENTYQNKRANITCIKLLKGKVEKAYQEKSGLPCIDSRKKKEW